MNKLTKNNSRIQFEANDNLACKPVLRAKTFKKKRG